MEENILKELDNIVEDEYTIPDSFKKSYQNCNLVRKDTIEQVLKKVLFKDSEKHSLRELLNVQKYGYFVSGLGFYSLISMYDAKKVDWDENVTVDFAIFSKNSKYYAVKSTPHYSSLLLFEEVVIDNNGYFFEQVTFEKSFYKYVDYMLLARINLKDIFKYNTNKMELDEMVSYLLNKKISFELTGYADRNMLKQAVSLGHIIHTGDRVNNRFYDNDVYYIAASDLLNVDQLPIFD